MSDDAPPKTAYELAMERLRAEDDAHGVTPTAPLSAAQKRAIADARAAATSKLAELEILHAKALAAEADPAKVDELEANYRVDRGRVESALESKIARIRSDG